MKLPKGSKILFVCDAIDENLQAPKPRWGEPLTNGVSNLVRHSIKELENDYSLFVINPYMKENDKYVFKRFPLPRYKQFEVALPRPRKIWSYITDFKPDAIIITTVEATLGRTTKLLCHFPGSKYTRMGNKIPYTLTYTTNIDHYASLYIAHHTHGLIHPSSRIFNPLSKRFYVGAHKVLAPTHKTEEKLHSMGIHNTAILPRGVDTTLFRLRKRSDKNPYVQYKWYKDNPLPIYLYFGRVSLVKGIENFLSLQTPHSHKIIIGEGPYTKELQKKFTDTNIHFLGAFYDEILANYIRFSDLVFFPSKTDTWAQTITEAGASGVPVIAYNVPGSGEIITPSLNGIVIDDNSPLSDGIDQALKINRQECVTFIKNNYSWKTTAELLLENVTQIQWK